MSRMFAAGWRNSIARLTAGSVAGLLCCMPLANASNSQGTISQVFQVGSLVYVYVTKSGSPVDNCSSSRSYIVTHVDPATAIGKAQLAMALSAHLSGARVYMQGSGVCTTSGTPNGDFSEPMTALQVVNATA